MPQPQESNKPASDVVTAVPNINSPSSSPENGPDSQVNSGRGDKKRGPKPKPLEKKFSLSPEEALNIRLESQRQYANVQRNDSYLNPLGRKFTGFMHIPATLPSTEFSQLLTNQPDFCSHFFQQTTGLKNPAPAFNVAISLPSKASLATFVEGLNQAYQTILAKRTSTLESPDHIRLSQELWGVNLPLEPEIRTALKSYNRSHQSNPVSMTGLEHSVCQALIEEDGIRQLWAQLTKFHYQLAALDPCMFWKKEDVNGVSATIASQKYSDHLLNMGIDGKHAQVAKHMSYLVWNREFQLHEKDRLDPDISATKLVERVLLATYINIFSKTPDKNVRRLINILTTPKYKKQSGDIAFNKDKKEALKQYLDLFSPKLSEQHSKLITVFVFNVLNHPETKAVNLLAATVNKVWDNKEEFKKVLLLWGFEKSLATLPIELPAFKPQNLDYQIAPDLDVFLMRFVQLRDNQFIIKTLQLADKKIDWSAICQLSAVLAGIPATVTEKVLRAYT